MGKIKSILYERPCGPGFYDKSARIEIEECLHVHYNDMRIFMDKDTFLRTSEMFIKAREEYDRMGQPESLNNMVLLADTELNESKIKPRIAIEIQKDNRVHIHYNDLRIHIGMGDLMVWFETFSHANRNIPDEYISFLRLSDCTYHPVVDDYVRFLKDAEEKKVYMGNPIRIKRAMFKTKFDVGDLKTRNFGLPEGWPNQTAQAFDYAYLTALYCQIRQEGYGSNSNQYNFMVAYQRKPDKDGKQDVPRIINSHRLAVLKALGYETVWCYVVEPDSGWVE